MKKLTDEEQKAINILKEHGWQIVEGPYLEDWDEDCSVEVNGQIETSVKADIAVIKIDL